MERAVTLLILPGLDGTEAFFRPFLRLLPEWVHPHVVSYPPTGANDYPTLLRLVQEQTADLPDYFVLGSSFSGPLAIMLAAAEASRVRGIILSATFLRTPNRTLSRFQFAVVGPVFWVCRTARRLPVWVFRRSGDPLRQAKAETWRRVTARSLATRLRAVLGVDVRERWRECAAPALCLAFADDKTVPSRCAEEILRCRPSTRLISIPGGHLAMCDNPEPWTQEIVRFIAQVVRAPSDHSHRA